MGGGGGDGSGG
ncbi:hypothetical protein A2U01_0117210, partial [Trifolium medium]|nr:hypothetical protein [Trifolium medium]